MEIDPKINEFGKPVCNGEECPNWPKDLTDRSQFCWGHQNQCIPALEQTIQNLTMDLKEDAVMSEEKTDREILEEATPGSWGYDKELREIISLAFKDRYLDVCIVGHEQDGEFLERFDPPRIAEMLDRIEQLEASNKQLQWDLDRSTRTHNIDIIVKDDRMRMGPYDRYDAKVVDIGHADHAYVVESEKLNQERKRLVDRIDELESEANDRVDVLQENSRLKELLRRAIDTSLYEKLEHDGFPTTKKCKECGEPITTLGTDRHPNCAYNS
jgi:hypothetical protein